MAWTLISSLDTPSSGVFDFPSLTLTGYSVLEIICSGITVTTDGTDPKLTFYVGGSEVVTGYRWADRAVSASLSGIADGQTSSTSILLGSNDAAWDVGNAATESFGARIVVDNPLSTALYKKVTFESWMVSPAGNPLAHDGAGLMENAGAIGGLKISGTSNLTAGKVRILGL